MAKGRKRLPQELLDLRGTARKDRLRPASVSGPKMVNRNDVRLWTHPGYQVLCDRAKKIYARAARECMAIGVLQSLDLDKLVMYAREYDAYLSACEDVQLHGSVLSYEDKLGNKKYYSNPSVIQASAALKNANAIGSSFGFSPVDRQRLHVDAQEDPLEKIKKIMSVTEIEYDNGPDDQ